MFSLYIDESGKSNLRQIDSARPHFSLAAIITENSDRQKLRERADHIRFKYWGRTDIVFHANELFSLRGAFEQFRPVNKPKFSIDDFCQDFIALLRESDFQVAVACLNKEVYLKNNPTIRGQIEKLNRMRSVGKDDKSLARNVFALEKNIVQMQATKILIMYLYHLIQTKETGQVVIEATGDPQDLSLFAAYNQLLSYGYDALTMKGQDVRRYFTSVSFVTKANNDTETQLADTAAYFLNMHERSQDNTTLSISQEYKEVISILRGKAFQYAETSGGSLLNSLHRYC